MHTLHNLRFQGCAQAAQGCAHNPCTPTLYRGAGVVVHPAQPSRLRLCRNIPRAPGCQKTMRASFAHCFSILLLSEKPCRVALAEPGNER